MTAAQWGKQLAAARRAHGWTQESLAEQLGVSRQAVAKWERGAAIPGSANLLALRQCLGDALPEPPGPAVQNAAEETPQVAEAQAENGAGERSNTHLWLAVLAVLCVVFCLISLVTYVFTALAGVYLLLVTVAAVAIWAVVCKVRGRSAVPALWGGLKAVGVQLTALAVAAVFAYFVWLAGAGYRVDALVPLTETAVRQYPALAEAVDRAAMDETPCALCIGGPVPGQRTTKRYLVAAKGVTGEPVTRIRTQAFRIRLTWQSGDPDEMQYYLIQCSGDRDFNMEVMVEGASEQQIGMTALPETQQMQAQWDTDLQELWQESAR